MVCAPEVDNFSSDKIVYRPANIVYNIFID